MKRLFHILFILVAVVLLTAACASRRHATRQHANAQSVPDSEENVSPSTLIILYDTTTGSGPLLKAVRKYGATLLYEYNIIHGIAISIPRNTDIHAAMRHFRGVKGVLSVQRDRIMHLDGE